MPAYPVSRRRFLALAGLGTAAALGACALSNTPANILSSPSPMPTTPFRTGTVILGESAGTVAMLSRTLIVHHPARYWPAPHTIFKR